MRVPSLTRSGDLGFNMTPMIDIVFLLIIFFLVSSHLAKQDVQMALDLPEAKSGRPADDTAKQRLVVNVSPEGAVTLAGHRVTPDQLQARLIARREESGGQLEVRVRSDKGVPFRVVAPVLLACAKSKVSNVVVGVFPQNGSRK